MSNSIKMLRLQIKAPFSRFQGQNVDFNGVPVII